MVARAGYPVSIRWRDVWICPLPSGHIQAIGTDDAGRRQYRYYDEWRRHRDAEKHDRMLRLGRRLPAVRAQIREQLDGRGLRADRVLAAVLRMLDIKELAGAEFSAKDLRTWNATVLAAFALAESAAGGVPPSQRGRTRAIHDALDEVAEHLGNTRAVARSSYVDPRVLEHYVEGRTILRAVRRAETCDLIDEGVRNRLERAVLRLLHTDQARQVRGCRRAGRRVCLLEQSQGGNL